MLVDTSVERAHAIFLRTETSHRDNLNSPRCRFPPKASRDRKSVQARQPKVEQYNVRANTKRGLNSPVAVARRVALVAPKLYDLTQRIDLVRVVIHH